MTTGRIRAWPVAALPLTALLLYVHQPLGTQARRDELEVTFLLRAKTVSLHEPVLVDFTLRNGTPEPITVDLGKDRDTNFAFVVTDAKGSKHSCSPLNQAGFGRTGEVHVAPGDSITVSLLVDEWYPFSLPGTYGLEPRLVGAVRGPRGAAIRLRSSPVEVLVVTHRDVARLERVCASLSADALGGDAAVALIAAKALSYVPDTVALPYLARVARRRDPIRNFAVIGLARIARTVGLQIVLKTLGPSYSDLEPEVRAALTNLEQHVGVAD